MRLACHLRASGLHLCILAFIGSCGEGTDPATIPTPLDSGPWDVADTTEPVDAKGDETVTDVVVDSGLVDLVEDLVGDPWDISDTGSGEDPGKPRDPGVPMDQGSEIQADACVPDCDGLECGGDGCGGTCGTCDGGAVCQEGRCTCLPEDHKECCGDAVCWVDTCGNPGVQTASCPFGCEDAMCLACEPNCDGLECGDDGCGGSCGECTGATCQGLLFSPPQSCNGGSCVPDAPDQDCDDGVACTEDSCDVENGCSSLTGPDWCRIAEDCIPAGERNPANPCESCDPARAGDRWSPLEDGEVCGASTCDGLSWRAPLTCVGGTCVGEGVVQSCDDNLWCTADSCDPAAGCRIEVISYSCMIDGACHTMGVTNGPCLVCNPNKSATSWTGLTGSCDDSDPCTLADTCIADGGGGAVCRGTPYACESPGICEKRIGASCNGDGTCTYLAAAVGDTCDDGNACTKWDRCQADKKCAGTQYSCPEKLCEMGVCSGDGTCTYKPLPGHCNLQDIGWGCPVAGQGPGDIIPGHPFDACLVCDPFYSSDSYLYWSVRDGFCFIDGACRIEGEINSDSTCRDCYSRINHLDWWWRNQGEMCRVLQDDDWHEGNCEGDFLTSCVQRFEEFDCYSTSGVRRSCVRDTEPSPERQFYLVASSSDPCTNFDRTFTECASTCNDLVLCLQSDGTQCMSDWRMLGGEIWNTIPPNPLPAELDVVANGLYPREACNGGQVYLDPSFVGVRSIRLYWLDGCSDGTCSTWRFDRQESVPVVPTQEHSCMCVRGPTP